jgi:hypothetical protein
MTKDTQSGSWLGDLISRIESHQQAMRLTRAAAWVAAAQASLTFLVVIAAIVVHHAIAGIGAWSIIDFLLLGIMSWRLFRSSFTWAVFTAVYQTLNIFYFLGIGKHNVVVGVIFLVAYIGGVRGTWFLYHERKSAIKQTLNDELPDQAVVKDVVPTGGVVQTTLE